MTGIKIVLSSPEALQRFENEAVALLEYTGERTPDIETTLERKAIDHGVHRIDAEAALERVLNFPNIREAFEKKAQEKRDRCLEERNHQIAEEARARQEEKAKQEEAQRSIEEARRIKEEKNRADRDDAQRANRQEKKWRNEEKATESRREEARPVTQHVQEEKESPLKDEKGQQWTFHIGFAAIAVLMSAVIGYLFWQGMQPTPLQPIQRQTQSASSVPEVKVTNSSEKMIRNNLGMTFVLIPAGTFIMGSPLNEPGRFKDERQHRVTISQAFFMQTTEVTQGQWETVMGNIPRDDPWSKGSNMPVEEGVSWNDAQAFIGKLNAMEKTDKYRLPTEAEWEYACRAGTTTPFSTGNCLSTDQANYNGLRTLQGCPKGEYRISNVRVGSFAPNAWGLFDMHGNVTEWCQNRIRRGCSHFEYARLCRSANRHNYSPVDNYAFMGVRLVRAK